MANKIIKIERFYSDGINENTSKIKNVVKIIEPKEIEELKEKIPTVIKEKELRKDKNHDYKNEQDKYIDVIKKKRNIKIKKKKKIKERDDNGREIEF